MIELRARLEQSLLYIAPRYHLSAGTDFAVRIERCQEWGDAPISALVNGTEHIEAVGDVLTVHARLAVAPHITITLYAGERIVSVSLEILIAETIGGNEVD